MLQYNTRYTAPTQSSALGGLTPSARFFLTPFNVMKKLYRLLIFVCFLGVLSSGCGKGRFAGVVPAEGIVMYNGSPLSDAKVLFYPEVIREDNVMPVSITDQNGRFVLLTHGEARGAFPGSYKVVIIKHKIVGYQPHEETGEDMPVYGLATPDKYAQESTTDLVVTIPERGSRELNITLE